MTHPGYYPHPMWQQPPGIQYPHYPEDDHLSDYHSSSGSLTTPTPPNRANLGALVADQSTWLSIETSLRSTPVSGACLSAAHNYPPGGDSPFYVDSGASMHCTAFLSDLSNLAVLDSPVAISGIGDGTVTFTHVGDLLWLPAGLRTCYYSRDLGTRLT